uniref:Uncharacterized protein n=1 Tax=Panagrolaimus davidi TaxID=227884 RepID=A0A914P9J4_9BILA
MFFPNRVQFLSTYHRQCFALPDPIMEYIAKNPEFAELYQKLIESCKYFFIKNPILVIHDLRYNNGNGWEMRSLISDDWKKVDMKKLSCKLWITGSVNVIATTSDDKNALSLIIPKIDECQAESLDLFGQDIFYEELDILGTFAKDVYLYGSVVKYQNGKNVELEKIVQVFPEATDIFFVFIKTNKHTRIRLEFAETISEAYNARLNAVVDEILEIEESDYTLD